MKDRPQERVLALTEEEALGLLDLALTCPGELSSEQRNAMVKLSEFCRQFLREEAAVSAGKAGRTTSLQTVTQSGFIA